MLKARVIKSEGCFKCKNYLKHLKLQKYDFLIYDADDKANTKELDKWKIDAMPVVQIVDVDNECKVLHQFPPGRLSIRSLDRQIKILSKKTGAKK